MLSIEERVVAIFVDGLGGFDSIPTGLHSLLKGVKTLRAGFSNTIHKKIIIIIYLYFQ